MKTQILRLDSHDDVVSARDKMDWNQADRVLLVWPDQGQILARPLDLVLLQRHSLAMGAQLALVTRDPDVRYHARNLGIPVFNSLRRAQSSRWRVPRHLPRLKASPEENEAWPAARRLAKNPEPVTQPFPQSILVVVFTLGIVAVLLLAAALFPSAAITLHPKTQEQDLTLQLRAVPQLASFKPDGSLPLQRVEVVVEGRDQQAASGSISIPDQSASGWVQFRNLTNERVNIPAGTVVVSQSANPVRFALVTAVELAAGTDQSVAALVRAVEPGSQGNLAAQTISGVEGQLGVLVTVTNPSSTTGGRDRQVPAPTTADRTRLSARLLDSLRESAFQELQDGLSRGDILISSSFNLVETLEETYTPEDNQPGDQLELSLRLIFAAEKVAAEDLRAQVEKALDERLPGGYSALPDTLNITSLSDPVINAGEPIQLEARARRQIQSVINRVDAIRVVVGQTPSQAAQRLSMGMPLAGVPQIRLQPAWWPRLPFLPFRIAIEVQPGPHP